MKYLSAIKPTLIGDRGRDISLSTSLTHIKYNHVGDATSENLVAFNSFAPNSIDKAGGVFNGPITTKTKSSSLITAVSSDGIVTINLAFGMFFKLVLTENVNSFEVINVPPQANMFMLIIEQDAAAPRTVNWVFNQSVIKWENATPATITTERTNLDIFSFKTVSSGNIWYASTNGQNFLGVGTDNPADGTFLYNENLFLNIDGVNYINGYAEVLADGLGGTRSGNVFYPPAYPDPSAITFKYSSHNDLYIAACDFSYPNGSTLWVSNGSGGYQIVDEYPQNGAIFCEAPYAEQHYGQSIVRGSVPYIADGAGFYNQGSVAYEDFENYEIANPIVFRDDAWYQGTVGSAISNGTITVAQRYGVLSFTSNHTPENVYVATDAYWRVGYYLDFNNPAQIDYSQPLETGANVVSDGQGKVYYQAYGNDGDYLWSDYRVFDCGHPLLPCDDFYNQYVIRYMLNLTASVPEDGPSVTSYGYVMPQKRLITEPDMWSNLI